MAKFLFEVKYLEGETIGKKEIEAYTFDDACDLIDKIENDILVEGKIITRGSYQTTITPIVSDTEK
jgi:hypothetical protein